MNKIIYSTLVILLTFTSIAEASVTSASEIFNLDFESGIVDSTGNFTPVLDGTDHSVTGGVCETGNTCYNVGIFNNGIDLGGTLLSDNPNWTVSFNAYTPSASAGSYVSYISQYLIGGIGRFYVGKSNGDHYAVKVGSDNLYIGPFNSYNTWQKWVVSKNGNAYKITIDGNEVLSETSSIDILNTTNTRLGLLATPVGTSYIDDVRIFNEFYTYTEIIAYIGTATSSIELTSPGSYQIYQRDSSNEATISVAGSVTTATPVDIEMSYDGGDYVTIASGVTGSFTHNFTASTSMGDLIVRMVGDTSVSDTASNVGVGDLFLLIGQSNQDGRANSLNNFTPTSGVYASMFQQTNRCEYYVTSNAVSGSWKVNNDSTGNGNASGCGTHGSQWPLVATDLVAEFGVPVGWITGTYGGTSITSWQDGSIHYERALQLVSQATGGANIIKGILWHQGEDDSAVSQSSYYGNLSAMVSSLETDLTFDKMLVAIVSQNSSYGGGDGDGPQRAQHQVITDLSAVYLGNESYDIGQSVDSLHYKTTNEITEFARRWYLHIAKEFYGKSVITPQLGDFYKHSTNVLAIKINQDVEISDYLRVAGTTAGGFTVVNNATPITSYTTTVTQENGQYLVLVDIGTEVHDSTVTLSYAAIKTGYDTSVLRSKDYYLPANRKYNAHYYTPPTITIVEPDTSAAQSKTISAIDNDASTTTWSYKQVTAATTCNAATMASGTTVYTEGSSIVLSSDSANTEKLCFTSTDSSGDIAYTASNTIGGIDSTSPTPISVTLTTATTTATVTWTTSEAASSIIDYGLTSVYGISTAEINTSTGVTSHSVSLSDLFACTTYHYSARSRDAVLNAGSSTDSVFMTDGCTGSASPEESSSATVTKSTGATLILSSGTANLSMTVPANFATTSNATVEFQLNQLNTNLVILTTHKPSGKNVLGDHTYKLLAFDDTTTPVGTFSQAVTITISYTDAEASSIRENTLAIYYWTGSAWSVLDSCSVDTGANTVTCTTTHFTTFGVFGTDSTVTSGGALDSDGDGMSDVQKRTSGTKPYKNEDIKDLSYIEKLRAQLADLTRRLRALLGGSTEVVSQEAPVVTTQKKCPYFTTFYRKGEKNQGEIKKIQELLMTENLFDYHTATGFYGPITDQGIRAFQLKYASDILKPWGETEPTGYWYITTRKKANELVGCTE